MLSRWASGTSFRWPAGGSRHGARGPRAASPRSGPIRSGSARRRFGPGDQRPDGALANLLVASCIALRTAFTPPRPAWRPAAEAATPAPAPSRPGGRPRPALAAARLSVGPRADGVPASAFAALRSSALWLPTSTAASPGNCSVPPSTPTALRPRWPTRRRPGRPPRERRQSRLDAAAARPEHHRPIGGLGRLDQPGQRFVNTRLVHLVEDLRAASARRPFRLPRAHDHRHVRPFAVPRQARHRRDANLVPAARIQHLQHGRPAATSVFWPARRQQDLPGRRHGGQLCGHGILQGPIPVQPTYAATVAARIAASSPWTIRRSVWRPRPGERTDQPLEGRGGMAWGCSAQAAPGTARRPVRACRRGQPAGRGDLGSS